MTYPYDLVSGDAQRALEVFQSEFNAALESVDPASEWSRLFGLVNTSRNIRTTYPIPISAAGYVERKGDDPMRSLYHRSISMKPKTWVDGIAELASVLEAPDFVGWVGEPARIAREARRHPNTLVAQLLHANPNLGFYKDETLGTDLGIPLFSSSHRVNIFDDVSGTFSNVVLGGGTDFAGGNIDQAMLKAVMKRMRAVKSSNGQPMRLSPSHMIVHPDKEQEAKDFLESDLMRVSFLEGGDGSQKNTDFRTNNRFKGLVQLVVADELAGVSGVDADKVYFVDASAGAKPWIIQDGGEIEQIVHDKSDSLYKSTGKVGVRYVLELAVAAALPHAIIRVDLTP
jgi:hypothetical protein